MENDIHSILAAKIGYREKSYEMYLRTARLDLDDYNNDTDDGLHITSMGGTWMAFVMGFGGMRVENGTLKFNPFLPGKWKSYSFRVDFRGAHLLLGKSKKIFSVTNLSEVSVPLEIWDETFLLEGNRTVKFTKSKKR
ncbi:MAG: hypothetical protein EOM73_17470 [Bacteroidia bacterium]|nr:hypothetical protein [Bacteroidia bacterium]